MDAAFTVGSQQINYDDTINALRNLESTRLCAFASVIIVFYDCLLSLEQEIQLVWNKPWSIIKCVYLWHRYFGVFCIAFEAVALSMNDASDKVIVRISHLNLLLLWALSRPSSCSFWFQWEVWCYLGLVFTSEVTLILWIWLIYNRGRLLFAALATAFVAEITSVIALLAMSMPAEYAQTLLLPGRSFCITTQPRITFKIVWLPIVAFDLCLLAMFMYKGTKISSFARKSRPFGVEQMVYRHTLLNFLAITASYIACAVIWLCADPGLAQIPVTFAMAFSVTNCTRLLLNIRRAYYFGTDDDEPGLLSWSVIAGDELATVSRAWSIPRLHGRSQASRGCRGDFQVEVAVEVVVNDDTSHDSRSLDERRYKDGYELSEIKHASM
ncbi:hypothetical protein BC629DRAFT_1589424 [Irpex lacteus]|nr:hypothetical protein BC629DRAFT_1589424 [Irpex lacteus]